MCIIAFNYKPVSQPAEKRRVGRQRRNGSRYVGKEVNSRNSILLQLYLCLLCLYHGFCHAMLCDAMPPIAVKCFIIIRYAECIVPHCNIANIISMLRSVLTLECSFIVFLWLAFTVALILFHVGMYNDVIVFCFHALLHFFFIPFFIIIMRFIFYTHLYPLNGRLG